MEKKLSQKRIDWISLLRGLTIVLVVMNHVRMLEISTGTDYAFIHDIRALFKPLRIPTFVFVSGALLYLTRVNKGWKTPDLYVDKIIRIGFPLIFCTFLGCMMQIVFNGFVKHPKDVGIETFFYSFVDYDTTPWPHRWYLITLLFMMALYPLYLLVLRMGKRVVIFLGIILFALYPFDFRQYTTTNWCQLFTLNKYLPFFFTGIVSFKYSLWKYLDNKVALLVCFVLYWGTYFAVPHNNYTLLLMSISGIMFMISLCLFLSHPFPKLFSSFRNYIFQIYLFGIAFQAFVELILWRALGCPDSLVYLFYVLNILAGVYLPVLMSKIIEKIPYRPIRLCFGLN